MSCGPWERHPPSPCPPPTLPGSQLGTRTPEGGSRESSEEAAWGERRCRRLKSLPPPLQSRHPCQAMPYESLSLSFLGGGWAEPEVNIKGTSWNLDETEEGHGQDQVVLGGAVVALPFPICNFMPQRAKYCSFPECFFFSLFSRCLSSLNLSL